MAKKAKKKTGKSSPKKRKKPSDFSLVALDVVEAAIGEQLTQRKKKSK